TRLSVAKTGENPNLQYNLRGLLFRQACKCGVKGFILGRRWGAELHVWLADLDVGRQATFVDAGVSGSEIAHRREQQSAAIGKLHELLACGTTERALADQFGASVAAEGGREQFGRRRGSLIDQQDDRSRNRAVARRGGDVLALRLGLPDRQRAARHEESRRRDAVI